MYYTKRSQGSEAVDRLRDEANVLRRTAHPNIVELIDFRVNELSTEAELILGYVNGIPLTEVRPALRQGTALIGQIAATLGELHRRNIAHTRIAPEHVIISAVDRRPVLCGFAEAKAASTHSHLDIEALGRMLNALTRVSAGSLRNSGNRHDRFNREISSIAWRCMDHDVSNRPTAHELALALRSAIDSSANKPRDHKRRSLHLDRFKHLPRKTLLPAGGAIVMIAAVGLIVTQFHPGTPGSNNKQIVASAAAAANTSQRQTKLDTDGDGQPNDVQVRDGSVIVDGERFDVGSPNDQLLLGKWDCKRYTAALLKSSDGRVFVFDTWPTSGNQLSPRQVGMATKGQLLNITQSREGCDQIKAIGTGGQSIVIDPKKATVAQ